MYTIELTSEAENDLKWFDRRDRNIIVDGIQTNLSYELTVMTMNRKPCRDDGQKLPIGNCVSACIGYITA